MMLFLMSLSCVAAPFSGFGQTQQPQPNITLTLAAGGRLFKAPMQKAQNRMIPFTEIGKSSIFILGENGQFLFSGSFAPTQVQASQSPTFVAPESQVDFTQLDIENKKWNSQQIPFQAVQQIEIIGTFGWGACPFCIKAQALAEAVFGPAKVKKHNIKKNNYARRSQEILNAVGMGDYGFIPRVSVISFNKDGKTVRWVLGGFSDLQNFVNATRGARIGS